MAEGKASDRDDAEKASGLFNVYDTCNGISLEARLHTAFDSYLWCMDEKGIFCLSDAERDAAKILEYGLAKWKGNELNLGIGRESGYPTEQLLKARYDLFRAKVEKKKRSGGRGGRGRGRTCRGGGRGRGGGREGGHHGQHPPNSS